MFEHSYRRDRSRGSLQFAILDSRQPPYWLGKKYKFWCRYCNERGQPKSTVVYMALKVGIEMVCSTAYNALQKNVTTAPSCEKAVLQVAIASPSGSDWELIPTRIQERKAWILRWSDILNRRCEFLSSWYSSQGQARRNTDGFFARQLDWLQMSVYMYIPSNFGNDYIRRPDNLVNFEVNKNRSCSVV